ncbi:hypothetical protein UCRPC4_g04278 [Phaeomoniella chlamydospora]|uniref:DUF1479-domain-containing protein n=1 Tax=Phaeomoniella chlamydospora TaxID=158046 RepID=A0A0G2G8K0_PHACM|nr:hypothetical protein UCRPC4_g04278 [Phaeomoniella chlamydospora]
MGEALDDLVLYKKSIAKQFGEENIRRGWLKVCKELETITDNLAAKGTSAIPEVDFEDLFSLPEESKQKLKDIGCFVVRGVVDREQVDTWFNDLKSYVAENRSSITGWPAENPFVLNLYFTPTQIAARSHPNQLRVAKELNSWWHDSSDSATADPLSYADAVRIRPPGVPFYGLGPHIDAGSLSRWADSTYRSCYAPVFEGHPEDLDLYNIGIRKDAKQAMFEGSAHSRVFRAFQGWTALTSAGPGEGSLMLYPAVKWAIAYVMLRPFFKEPAEENILDATKWTFDLENPWFPGTFREDSQLLSPSSHPHLRLKECMVNIPQMYPGDTIWWHADMCHAVEVDHNGDHEASVAYIAATPSTDVNKAYIAAQLKDFLEGRPPEDFRNPKKKLTVEKDFVGYSGERAILSPEGRLAMGFVH